MPRRVWVATATNEKGCAALPGMTISLCNAPEETTVTDLLQSRWRISDQAIANAVADETVILHLGNGTYYGLDPIGARLWEAMVAGQAPETICAGVLETYDVARDQLAADLRALLADLADNGLIEPAA